jgi:hypothetical protein
MKRWLHRVEKIIDKIIPYTLVVLLVIIILEIFYHDVAVRYHTIIEVLDFFIIFIFATDLIFKYNKVRNVKKFLKRYWLDIIAIFPFFLVFRVFEEVALIFEGVRELISPTQKVLHEGLEIEKIGARVGEALSKERMILQGIEKESAKLIKEAESIGKVARTEKLSKFFRPVARSLRFAKFESKETKQDVLKEAKYLEKKALKGERFVEREIKKGEKYVVKEEKKLNRFFKAFLFYEKPSGKHYHWEKKR